MPSSVDCGGDEDCSAIDETQKKTMITANDRIGDAPENSGSRPAYSDGLQGAMIAAA